MRHMLRTIKTYVVRCLCLRRTAKVFAEQKCVVRPLSCARAESARQRLCRAGSGLCRAPVAHGKARESGSAPIQDVTEVQTKLPMQGGR
jgi:hypothetical protein